jgi:hypothetical protein
VDQSQGAAEGPGTSGGSATRRPPALSCCLAASARRSDRLP